MSQKLSFPESATLWSQIDQVMGACEEHVLLYGPPGTGKSTFAFMWAKNASRPIGRLHMTRDSYDAEVVGHFGVNKEGNLSFIEREGLRMARAGGVLLVDDIHQAQGSGEEILLAMCDDRAVASFNLPWGEEVRPAQGFRVVATSNADPEALSDPLRDRLMALKVDMPSPKALKSLAAMNQEFGPAIAQSVYNAYLSVRKNEREAPMISFRQGQRVARLLLGGLKLEDALIAAFHNEATRTRVADAIQAARSELGAGAEKAA